MTRELGPYYNQKGMDSGGGASSLADRRAEHAAKTGRLVLLAHNEREQAAMIDFLRLPGQFDTSQPDQLPRWRRKHNIEASWNDETQTGHIVVDGYQMDVVMTQNVVDVDRLAKEANVTRTCILTGSKQEAKDLKEAGYTAAVMGGIEARGVAMPEHERAIHFGQVWANLVANGFFRDTISDEIHRTGDLARLVHQLTPVYATHADTIKALEAKRQKTGKLTPVLIGCGHYTESGEDMAETLLPQFAEPMVQMVSDLLATHAEALHNGLTIVTAGPDLLQFDLARYLLPPFPGVIGLLETDRPALESKLARSFALTEQIAEAITVRGIPTQVISYADFVGADRLRAMEALASQPDQQPIFDAIYEDRAARYPFYAKTDKADAMRRVQANASLYYAVAQRITAEESDTLLLDAENDPDYWRKLTPGVKTALKQGADVVQGETPAILMLPKEYCQPWSAERGRTPAEYVPLAQRSRR